MTMTTLPAFATERRAAAPLLLSVPAAGTRRRRPQLSIDISCLQGAQQQTRQPPLLLSIDGIDRRTDAIRLLRSCSAYMLCVRRQ